jgi:hypothetical protein
MEDWKDILYEKTKDEPIADIFTTKEVAENPKSRLTFKLKTMEFTKRNREELIELLNSTKKELDLIYKGS